MELGEIGKKGTSSTFLLGSEEYAKNLTDSGLVVYPRD
jgi:hypothetical protein